jgi:hypothetical protein
MILAPHTLDICALAGHRAQAHVTHQHHPAFAETMLPNSGQRTYLGSGGPTVLG